MPSRIKLDEEKVKEVVKQFAALDVFGTSTGLRETVREDTDKDLPLQSKLVATATKDVAFPDITNDLLTAGEIGQAILIDYTQ